MRMMWQNSIHVGHIRCMNASGLAKHILFRTTALLAFSVLVAAFAPGFNAVALEQPDASLQVQSDEYPETKALSAKTIRSLLSPYSDWYAGVSDGLPVYVCPKKNVSTGEMLRYLHDIEMLLWKSVGSKHADVEIYFPFTGSYTDDEFELLYDKYYSAVDLYYCFWNGLKGCDFGSGSGEYPYMDAIFHIGPMNAEYYPKLKKIVDQAKQSCKSNYELALYFDSYVRKHVTYTADHYYPSDAALLEGIGVCMSYSCLFYDMCQMAGIPCMTYSSDEAEHMWNAVYFDGTWYDNDLVGYVDSRSETYLYSYRYNEVQESEGVKRYKQADCFFTDPTIEPNNPDDAALLRKELVDPTVFLNTPKTLKLKVGDKVAFSQRVRQLGSGAKVSYASDSKSVVGVNSKGVLTPKKVGKATLTVKVQKGGASQTLKQKLVIGKGVNPLVAKAKAKAVKAKSLKKKAVTLKKTVSVKKAKGKVSYKNASKAKKLKRFKVNSKTGAITAPKGTKKGTYKVKVKVTAKGDANYKAGSKTVTVKVKVKVA